MSKRRTLRELGWFTANKNDNRGTRICPVCNHYLEDHYQRQGDSGFEGRRCSKCKDRVLPKCPLVMSKYEIDSIERMVKRIKEGKDA